MKNKIFALLLSACMCFTLCACGDGAESNEKAAPAQVNPVGMTEAAKETQAAVENEIVTENEQETPAAVKTEESEEKNGKAPLVKGSNSDVEGGIISE